MTSKRKPPVAKQWKKARKRRGDVALHNPHVAQHLTRRAVELRRQSEQAFQPTKESDK